jgi:hypothetical protein
MKRTRLGLAMGLTLLYAFACAAANAQTPPARADLTGIWSGNFTTQDNEFWLVEDFTACFAGCTPASRAYFRALLDDPANDDRAVRELWDQTTGFMRRELAEMSTPAGIAMQNRVTEANDPTILCKPYGLVRAATNPLPMAIRRDGDNLVFEYEEWNQSRTIYLDGRGHPAGLRPTPLGHSIGHYEGDALIVETVGIEGDIYFSFQSGGGYSDRATVVERYAIAADPRRLELTLTVTDPVMLTAPYTIQKVWLYTPDVEMVEDRCEEIPGKP